MSKVCVRCKKTKSTKQFSKCKKTKDNLQSYCKQCSNEYRNTPEYRKYRKKYYRENLEIYKGYSKKERDRNKQDAIKHYGGKCKCCGEKETVFLTVDHINGGGRKHLKEIGGHLYRWLRQNDYPEGFQILCWNCNIAKYILGKCPHKGGKRG